LAKDKLIIVGLISCFFLLFSCSSPQDDRVSIEGPYLGQPPPGMIPEVFAPGIISTGFHELDITFSPDLKELFFTRSGPDFYSAVILLEQKNGKWRAPETAPFSGVYSTNYPFASPDGKMIFFESTEPLTGEEYKPIIRNIFVSMRLESGWSTPKALDRVINTRKTEMFFGTARSGNLYFCANYGDSKGGFDIYMSEFTDDGYGHAVNLGDAINTKSNEFHPFIAPDESYIIFDAQRPNGFGANDLFISFRNEDGIWSKAQNMGDIINTDKADMRPYVSPDGKYFFFCSNRGRHPIDNTGRRLNYTEFMSRIDGPINGNQDIYWVDAKVIEGLRGDNRE